MINLKLSNTNRQFVNDSLVEVNTKSLQHALALALVLAPTLPLPSGQVDNPSLHFENTLRGNVLDSIDVINSLFTIDISRVERLVKSLYLWRYQVAFNPAFTMGAVKEGFEVSSVLGIEGELSRTELDTIKKGKFTNLRNSYFRLLEDVRYSKEES